MNEQISPTPETLQGAIRDPDALLSGQSREFDVEGSSVVVQRTPEGLSVVSENHRAVVIRPVADGRYVVTGATETARRSGSLSYGDAVDLALQRLRKMNAS